MAISKMRTTLSALRKELGHQGKEGKFSELTGLSVSWIKKASCGQIPIPMHSEAAYAICNATGVSMFWLCNGEPSDPIVYEPKEISNAINLRDLFAAHALSGMLSAECDQYSFRGNWEDAAIQSFQIADAMMEARNQ